MAQQLEAGEGAGEGGRSRAGDEGKKKGAAEEGSK